MANAQTPINDIIVLKSNDTIPCSITTINAENIYFTVENATDTSLIAFTYVKTFLLNPNSKAKVSTANAKVDSILHLQKNQIGGSTSFSASNNDYHAGFFLKRASTNFFAGTAVFFGTAFIEFLSIINGSVPQAVFVVVGVGGFMVAEALFLYAWWNIKKSGRFLILNKPK